MSEWREGKVLFKLKVIHIPTQVQRLGALDPVGVQADEDSTWLRLSEPKDGPEILKIVKKLAISDEDVGLTEDGLFGLRPTDRDRGMQLFRGKPNSNSNPNPNPNPNPNLNPNQVATLSRSRSRSCRVLFGVRTKGKCGSFQEMSWPHNADGCIG